MVFQRFPNSGEVFNLVGTFYFERKFLDYGNGLVIAKRSSVISQGFKRKMIFHSSQQTMRKSLCRMCQCPYLYIC
jgi:hypothetical protein